MRPAGGIEIEYGRDTYSDILARDGRYDPRAYDFVLAVLRELAADGESRASGQDALFLFRDMALDAWGPMAYAVLRDWGVARCEDVGEIVSNLLKADRIPKKVRFEAADFIGGFDFREEFLGPFEV